jgi:thiol-disulfide isomerase/thioredoxin
MQDLNGKEQSLHGVKSKYTLLVFWSPECGHCLHEIPRIDSVYKAVLKAKGVKVYSVRVEGDEQKWKDVIKKEGLEDWINVWDPEYKSNFRSKYNVYSTPVIYLLDERKIIRGKKLDHSTIQQVLEMLEKKDKLSNKSK